MSGAIRPLPQYASTAWCSVKALGQLYLYLCHYIVSVLYSVIKQYVNYSYSPSIPGTLFAISQLVILRCKELTLYFSYHITRKQQ